MTREGSEWLPGACGGPSGAGRQLGPKPGRRVALLVDAEPLAELPTRDLRAAPHPVQLCLELGP